MTLDELKVGEHAVITDVHGSGTLRLRMLDMGMVPGTEISVKKTAPFGDPIEISLRGYSLTMRRRDASMIMVEKWTGKRTGK